MKKLFIIYLGLLHFSIVSAQKSGSLTGTVTDKYLLNNLSGVSVELVEAGKAVTEDPDDKFQIVMCKRYCW
jgi:replicative DNA helicase